MRANNNSSQSEIWKVFDSLTRPDDVSLAVLSSIDPHYEHVFTQLADSSSLMPIPRKPLHWNDVAKRVPRSSDHSLPPSVSDFENLCSIKDKKLFEEAFADLFPARTKMDLSIRRNRANDFFAYLLSTDKPLLKFLFSTTIKKNFDYIFVCNIMNAAIIMGKNWIDTFSTLGAFDNDLEHYVLVAKKVNDIAKTQGIDDEHWTSYAEAATLCGYRNPPFPGFNPRDETEILAASGVSHNLFGFSFSDLCKTELAMTPQPLTTYYNFHDYVTSAIWLTSGASSVGKLEVQVSETKVKMLRAKKNTVPDVTDLEDLFSSCLDWNKQENYAIIKSELGKIRMAVASDMQMYLQMSWINYLLNGAYNQWPGSTTDEDFVKQTQRMYKMLTLCGKMLGLPFDYKGFDHQPTTVELQDIVRVLLDTARMNVRLEDVPIFDLLSKNIIEGFDNSFLEWRNDEHRPRFKVTGGLMSGLRFTSIVGNAWNTVMTGLVFKLLSKVGISVDSIERFIRGDDSAIYVPNWGTGALVKLGYDAINIEAGDGKFSLQSNAMEFLRVWYSGRCFGYPLRALPGLLQRKPWTAEPWSPEGTIKSLYNCIVILRRRLSYRSLYIDRFWNFLKSRWCRDHNLPVECLRTPKFLGGLSVEGGGGTLYRIEPPILSSRKQFPSWLKVRNQNEWKANRMIAYFKERYDADINLETAKALAQTSLLDTLVSDDIPEVSSSLRKEWLSLVRGSHHRAVPIEVVLEATSPSVALDAFPLDEPQMLMTVLKERSPIFNSVPELATVVADYHTLRPELSLRKWLRLHFPKGAAALDSFHPSWYIGERIDYVTGKIPVVAERIHPMLTDVWQRLIAIEMCPHRVNRRLSFVQTAAALEKTVWSSSLSSILYSW